MNSCIYAGQIRHRRFKPREHAFNYGLFMLYLDLDELPTLFSRYWFWSDRHRAIARFRRSDHLGDSGTPLATAARDLVELRTGRRPTGPIRLLTHLSYFGYRFNPVSFYYCFEPDGRTVQSIIAEINNTPWGEQYCYVLDAGQSRHTNSISRFTVAKKFHVSPFMPMDIEYDWRFSLPDQRLVVYMQSFRQAHKIFDATLRLQQRPINSWQLARILCLYPLMTVKVIGAIYFEALRLWLKKIPFFTHPETEEAPEKAK